MKWKVLNSYGTGSADNGFMRMYPMWFRLHVMEVVVPRRVLTPEEQALWAGPAKRLAKLWFY